MYNLIIAILAIILIWLFWDFKFTKQQVADFYGVTRKTLNKWVNYFTSESFQESWKAKRKLTLKELSGIAIKFGIANSKEGKTKGEIIEHCSTDYKTLRENVYLNQLELGLSAQEYKSIDVFPPNLSTQIIQMMG